MKYYNTNYEFKQINSALIFSDMKYQRQLDVNRVKRIATHFNPDLVNLIKVSFRDGKYYVFDGQHTLAALKLRNGNRDLLVECKVYKGLTEQEEAALFAEQNGIYRAVKSSSKFKALYVSGEIDVVEMVNLTNRSGLFINFTNGTATNKIVCIAKAFKVFKSVSPSDYIEILKIIKDAWDGVSDSLRSEILGGVTLFYKTYKGDFKRDILVKHLSNVNPGVIVRDGNAFKETLPGDKKYAIQILQYYNKNLRGSKLPSKF